MIISLRFSSCILIDLDISWFMLSHSDIYIYIYMLIHLNSAWFSELIYLHSMTLSLSTFSRMHMAQKATQHDIFHGRCMAPWQIEILSSLASAGTKKTMSLSETFFPSSLRDYFFVRSPRLKPCVNMLDISLSMRFTGKKSTSTHVLFNKLCR